MPFYRLPNALDYNIYNLVTLDDCIEAEENSESEAAAVIEKGDKVKVLNAVQYGNGEKFTCYYDTYDVIQADGDRIVIGIGDTVTAAVSAENLKRV